jgi:hypothetical protein
VPRVLGVFENDRHLLAFTYAEGLGENYAMAPRGTPLDPLPMVEGREGWKLAGALWPGFFEELNAERRMHGGASFRLERSIETAIVHRALESLMHHVTEA